MKSRKIFIIAVLFAMAAVRCVSADMGRRDKARLGMALSYMGLHEYEEAAELLAALREDYPGDETVALELAKALGYTGELSGADALFESLPRDRGNVLAHASVLEANQEFERAVKKYKFLLEKYPGDLNIKEKLADASVWAEDLGSAGYYYARILSEKPEAKNIAARYADVLLRQEEYAEALQIYTDIGVRLEEDSRRYENMGEACLGLGKYAEAEKIFRRITDEYPENIRARIGLADAYYGLEEDEKAEEQVGIIMGRAPGDETRLRLAEVLAARGKHERAAEMLEGLPEKRPDDYGLLEFAADVFLGAGRHEDAESLYRKLLDAGHKPAETGIKLADVLRYQGKHDEALEIYREYLDE